MQRRQRFIDIMTTELGVSNPTLVDLVKLCLHNNPQKRPSSEQALKCLTAVKQEVERINGGRASKLIDIEKVLAKQQKQKGIINEVNNILSCKS